MDDIEYNAVVYLSKVVAKDRGILFEEEQAEVAYGVIQILMATEDED